MSLDIQSCRFLNIWISRQSQEAARQIWPQTVRKLCRSTYEHILDVEAMSDGDVLMSGESIVLSHFVSTLR